MNNTVINDLFQRCIDLYSKRQKKSIADTEYVFNKYQLRTYMEQNLESMLHMMDDQLYEEIDWFIEDCQSV